MKIRAAVAWEPKKPLSIEEIEIDKPREGEVLLQVVASGVCHTDAFTLSGDDPEGAFPCVLGHEGGCVVVECGPGVKNLKPGRVRPTHLFNIRRGMVRRTHPTDYGLHWLRKSLAIPRMAAGICEFTLPLESRIDSE